MGEESKTHIALFPAPGMGHLIPFIALARKLLSIHTFSITLYIPHDGSSTQPLKPFLQTIPQITPVFLPPPTTADLPPKLEDRIILSVFLAIPHLREALSQLTESRPAALIVDNFGVSAYDSVKDLGIPFYLFFLCNAMVLSLTMHVPQLDQLEDYPEPVQLPGCLPIYDSDLPEAFRDRKCETYKTCVEICRKYTSVDGILVNTFLDIEPNALNAFKQCGFPPVYPVGPLIRSVSEDAHCLKWLDCQPPGSVLFVSFGSGGTLSGKQLEELALGLEMSQQRFLLIVREPNDDAKNAAYFSDSGVRNSPISYLPSGFLERNNGTGLVLSNWGPQIEILSHGSVGGFLSHCGWNSTLESIAHGVPMIAWPLYAEQRVNAMLLSEGLRVAIRVKEDEKGIVCGEQVSELTRELMGDAGEEIRMRMRDLKNAAEQALSEGGSSTKSLANVAEIWKCGVPG